LDVTGASPGTTYEFKIEARNIIGYSAQSESLSIKAAIIPQAPTDIFTNRQVNDIIISWESPSSDPFSDYGDTIMGFKVYMRTSDSAVFAQD